jgi:enterochelin esterase-like enzyme
MVKAMNFFNMGRSDPGRPKTMPFPEPPDGCVVESRDLYVYLPRAYHANPALRFPVIYMLDGQNIWSSKGMPHGGWKAGQTLEKLIAGGKIQPAILAGIPSGRYRKEEYVGSGAFYGMDEAADHTPLVEKNKKMHTDLAIWIAETVKPLIDSSWRTKPESESTSIVGSSFGAGMALYLAFTYPHLFGKVASLSAGNYAPGMEQWAEKPYRIVDFLAERVIRKTATRVYLDCGSSGVDALFLPEAEKLHRVFLSLGWKEGDTLRWVFDKNAPHNERAWARRLPGAFMFLMQ